MKLLLIDDDHELAEMMSGYLSRNGYEVERSADGPTGLARALNEPFSLVLLDGMLPGLDGLEVLRQIRRRSAMAVIMLTARAAPESLIEGLDTGADDYLTKPFTPGELLARIRAVMRRMQSALEVKHEVIEVGGVRLDATQREGWLDGQCCHLTSLQFEILDHMMRNAGRAVSRDELTALLHQREATPFERWLDVHVSQLRKKIEADGRQRIRTLRGVGYMFAPPQAEPA